MELQTNLNCSELFLMTPKTKSYCTEYGHDNLSSGNNSVFCFDIFFSLESSQNIFSANKNNIYSGSNKTTLMHKLQLYRVYSATCGILFLLC